MAFFPNEISENAGHYLDRYVEQVMAAYASIDRAKMCAAAELLYAAIVAGRMIFSCGNGGSCAIANHLVCDYLKGVRSGTGLQPRVTSLSSNLEVITAVANDFAYDDIFAYQLRALARPQDILITITSSGNSPNVIKALEWARANDVRSIAMTGFDGGNAMALADIALHVAADNYGVVEDVHQSMMHLLAQYLRHRHLDDPSQLGQCRF